MSAVHQRLGAMGRRPARRPSADQLFASPGRPRWPTRSQHRRYQGHRVISSSPPPGAELQRRGTRPDARHGHQTAAPDNPSKYRGGDGGKDGESAEVSTEIRMTKLE